VVKTYFELIWEVFPLFCDNYFESSAIDVCSYGMWSIHCSLNISWKFIWLSVKTGVTARNVEHFYRLLALTYSWKGFRTTKIITFLYWILWLVLKTSYFISDSTFWNYSENHKMWYKIQKHSECLLTPEIDQCSSSSGISGTQNYFYDL
jgi:hypothetical protein